MLLNLQTLSDISEFLCRHSYLSSQGSEFKYQASDTREECGVNANKGSTAGVYLTSQEFLVITIRFRGEDQLQGDSYALRSFADGHRLFRKNPATTATDFWRALKRNIDAMMKQSPDRWVALEQRMLKRIEACNRED
ncbi:uncharacterized protein LOC134274511 [Saccostrea cucullata]|uniref:uncharacterized protein LOC134274511 n=1 Tax=Saccostrea cuccullata TaxID=36930 RepID=UPI002ED1CB1A